MSVQTPLTRQGTVVSIAGAFSNTEQQELLRTALKDIIDLRNIVDVLVTKYNAHTHACDGAQAGAYNCSLPQTNTQTSPLVPGTASAGSAPASIVTTI